MVNSLLIKWLFYKKFMFLRCLFLLLSYIVNYLLLLSNWLYSFIQNIDWLILFRYRLKPNLKLWLFECASKPKHCKFSWWFRLWKWLDDWHLLVQFNRGLKMLFVFECELFFSILFQPCSWFILKRWRTTSGFLSCLYDFWFLFLNSGFTFLILLTWRS